MLNQINLPNRLTLLRIFIVPLLIVFLITPSTLSSLMAALIFLLASFTDWLDGHLARSTNQITTLGKILDPIADKLLVCSALIPLVALGRVPSWIAVVIIGRELAITGLRSIGSLQGIVVPAGTMGKLKMGFEIVGIFFLILNLDAWVFHFRTVGLIFLVLGMVFGVISGVDYFIRIFQRIDLFENNPQPSSRPKPTSGAKY